VSFTAYLGCELAKISAFASSIEAPSLTISMDNGDVRRMTSFSLPLLLCFSVNCSLWIFYSLCLMLHPLLILCVCFPLCCFLASPHVHIQTFLQNQLAHLAYCIPFLYPQLLISSLKDLIRMDKIPLALACLDEEFLFIPTSFSNSWLAFTL